MGSNHLALPVGIARSALITAVPMAMMIDRVASATRIMNSTENHVTPAKR